MRQPTMNAAAQSPPAGYGATAEVSNLAAASKATGRQAFATRGQQAQDVAKRAIEEVQADLKVSAADFPALLAPWALFCICLLPVALMTEMFLSYLSVSLSIVLGVGFLLLSLGRPWKMLAVTCLAASGFGLFLGCYDRYKYLLPYEIYGRSPFHTNVLPSERPEAFQDAGYLSFSADARVDSSKGLGYRSGQLWCVAPIVGADRTSDVEGFTSVTTGFWAVGQDCCQKRGLFQCGDVMNPKARGGLVVYDLGNFNEPLLPTYRLAAQAASKTYGLMLPEQLVFVHWSEDPTVALAEMHGEATTFATLASALFLGIVPFFALILSCLNLSLTQRHGDSRDDHWCPDKIDVMRFGIDVTPRRYDREVQMELMNHRCYWSGEVIYDYVFHIANKHMFLGCLFCHPAHPFSKWERCIVCVIISMFIVFPVAAFSAFFGQTGFGRFLLVLFFVTIPRNLLKLYLIQISQEDSLLELERGQDAEGEGARRAFQWELTFLAGCFVVSLVTAAFCTYLIQQATASSLIDVLWRNCDGLGFAFILEPLLDLLVPFVGVETYQGRWTLGFFGRWAAERDFYHAPKREAAGVPGPLGVPRTLEGDRGLGGRPLFRSAGADILLGPTQAPVRRFGHASKRAS